MDDTESSTDQKLRGPLHFTAPSTGSTVVNMTIKREMLASFGFLLDYIHNTLCK